MHTRSAAREQSRKSPEVLTLDSSDDDDVVEINTSLDSANKSMDLPCPTANDSSVIIETPAKVQEVPPRSEASFEDYPYNLKLTRFGKFESYETTWKTKLSVALKDLIADLAKSNKTLVLLRRKDLSSEKECIPLDGTPCSLDLDSGTILDAIVIPMNHGKNSTTHPVDHQPGPWKDPNIIALKLQDGQRKHLKEYRIGKNEPLRILKERYSKDFDIDLNRMRLSFDGDDVNDDDTSDSLDIEDGCVIDVIVSCSK